MFKKLYFGFVFFSSLCGFAQTRQKIDSVYYLVDTAKIPANERMWDIHEEYPSFKVYIIQCPCLRYNNKPSFVYNASEVKDYRITRKQLKALKLINLPALIRKVKQFTAGDFKGKYTIFLVEPAGKGYVYHRVRLLYPLKPRSPSIDYEIISPPGTTKLKKP
jgi:hypothetical protein